jgi:hypothetical protein
MDVEMVEIKNPPGDLEVYGNNRVAVMDESMRELNLDD